MKNQLTFLVVAVIFALTIVLSGCAKISLTKPSGGSNAGVTQGGGGTAPAAPLDEEWVLSFEYGEQMFESTILFSHSGNQLAGQGTDSNGAAFYVQQGQIDGDNVRFFKKYADADPSKPPIEYTGKLEWVDMSDYKGWEMSGHYTTSKNGQAVEGKWVATPKNPSAAAGPAQPEGSGVPPSPGPGSDHSSPDSQQATGAEGPHISGMYTGSYQFNFKKVHCKMWLEQDGHNLTGHGVDVNTNEHFVIEKGWYHYPKLTLVRKYTKGKNAAATRSMTFKGQVSSGPSFQGETQYGGGWEAHIVR